MDRMRTTYFFTVVLINMTVLVQIYKPHITGSGGRQLIFIKSSCLRSCIGIIKLFLRHEYAIGNIPIKVTKWIAYVSSINAIEVRSIPKGSHFIFVMGIVGIYRIIEVTDV